MRLSRDFYLENAETLAKKLLGKVLCVKQNESIFKYRIVETEAYGGGTDRASHAYNFRKTPRNEVMYLTGGHVYVYFIYGMYYMLNIVVSHENNPEAVLIRAVEPLTEKTGTLETNGPGKLCKKLGIDLSFNKADLVTSDTIYLEDDGYEVTEIVYRKRINIDYALEDKERLWRFYLPQNLYVSKK